MFRFAFLILLIPSFVCAGVIEDLIKTHYSSVLNELHRSGFHGRLAHELGSLAFSRFILENGAQRPAEYCIPGLMIGGLNTKVVNNLRAVKQKTLKIGEIRDSDNYKLYKIEGDRANVWSTVAICHVLDGYIGKFPHFSEKERKFWELSKVHSYLKQKNYQSKFFDNTNSQRGQLLKKSNKIFGPKHKLVEEMTRKYEKIYDQVYSNWEWE